MAKERKRQVITIQQAQATTFQLPEDTQVIAGRKYILMIPDTQQVSTQAVQPSQVPAPPPPTVIVKVQRQRSSSVSSQPTPFLVVDDQQPGSSRQLIFTLSPIKTFNHWSPPDKLMTVNTTLLDYQVFLGVFHPYCITSTSTHHNQFHPLNFN